MLLSRSDDRIFSRRFLSHRTGGCGAAHRLRESYAGIFGLLGTRWERNGNGGCRGSVHRTVGVLVLGVTGQGVGKRALPQTFGACRSRSDAPLRTRIRNAGRTKGPRAEIG